MSEPNRFDQFRSESDLPTLRKLEVGEKFTARLLGVRSWTPPADQQTPNPEPIPVLDLEENGVQFSWMAGTWHSKEELAFANPDDGDVLKVMRLPNRGRSYQFRIETVERKRPPDGDVPIDDRDLPKTPEPQGGEQFGDVPF